MAETTAARGTRAMAYRIAMLGLGLAISPIARADDPPFPTTVQEAVKAEQDDALPLTVFYSQTVDLGASKPGALLAKEAVSDYAVPGLGSAARILYHSVQSGRHAVTSAAVLMPAGKAPEGGWPLIAWAHGTSGVARQCAPSAMKDVYYGTLGLSDMLKAGFAVVATDYHGLGTDGGHPYMNKADQAEDVIYSVRAAQAAFPEIGKKWVVDGHSQGGLAAWGVAELQKDNPDPAYLGAVAVAPAIHLGWLLDHPEATKGAGFYLAWHAYAVHQSYPDFKPADVLSDIALKHYDDVTTNGCWLYGFLTYSGVEGPQMVKPGWRDNTWVRRFNNENSAGVTPTAGPLLVIAGEADSAVPIEAVRDGVRKACAAKAALEFKSYPGLDHDPTMGESVGFQLDWIKQRFAGVPAPGNCSAAP